MENVIVLLSTYNGEKYLKEQLESVLAQQEINIHIFVRDDGSSDNTVAILEEYKSNNNLVYFKENNIGYAKSFMNLVKIAYNFDFYAFCDQDDVWDKDKLQIAIEQLKVYPQDQPCLYLSQTRIANDELNQINTDYHKRKVALGAVIEHNFAIGCTMVFNERLRNLLNIDISAMELSMGHDSWTFCVALSLTDNIYFDESSHMAYRQHDNNASGKIITLSQQIKAVRKVLFKWKHIRSSMSQKILESYYDIIPDHKRDILSMGAYYKRNIKDKMRLFKSTEFISDYLAIDMLSKIAILVNLF